MKAAIITFSPSGNTKIVSEMIKKEFENQDISAQLIDVTGSEAIFKGKDIAGFLQSTVAEHDILLLGCPVYAHHLQYNVKDLIAQLPKPDKGKWGRLAVPFVTYGGIDSGIALAEAGKLLKKSGRTVIGGMKFSASHRMTRAFLDNEFNSGKPNEEILPVIKALAEKLKNLDINSSIPDISKKLCYKSWKDTLKANIIFNEKKWHESRYPKVKVLDDKCVGCGECAKVCPVLHLEMDGKKVKRGAGGSCIHCFNCVVACKKDAVILEGDLERGRAFMGKMIKLKGNKEQPADYLYW